MSKHSNFTSGRVAEFECASGKKQSIYWDGKTPGLGLRVTEAGTKSYIFEAWMHGKSLRLTIGDARTWTISKAQAEATRLRSLTDQGIDPRHLAAEQQAKAEEMRKEIERCNLRVSDAWSTYIDARRPKWSVRHLADNMKLTHLGGNQVKGRNRLSEPGVLAALMPLKLSDINAEQVKAWLRDETAKRPTQAALAYRLLRAFLNWCSDTPDYRNIASPDACNTRIAKDNLPKKSAKSDCLQREQLPAWFAAVRSIQNPVIAAYLQTLLLTGARREELACVQWSDVNFKWNSLTIKDKVEGERTIPLTPFVSSLLSFLPHRKMIVDGREIDNPWVFSSPTAESGRLQEPSIQHRRACAAADVDGLTLHGLRRSFGTLAEWVECPAGVSAQIMGHKPSATAEKHYRVRPLDLLRQWHSKIESWILESAGVRQPYLQSEQPSEKHYAERDKSRLQLIR